MKKKTTVENGNKLTRGGVQRDVFKRRLKFFVWNGTPRCLLGKSFFSFVYKGRALSFIVSDSYYEKMIPLNIGKNRFFKWWHNITSIYFSITMMARCDYIHISITRASFFSCPSQLNISSINWMQVEVRWNPRLERKWYFSISPLEVKHHQYSFLINSYSSNH